MGQLHGSCLYAILHTVIPYQSFTFVSAPKYVAMILQVVGVEGHNPSGHCLIASRLMDAVPLSAATEFEEQLEPPSKRRDGSQEKLEATDPVSPEQLTIVSVPVACLAGIFEL